MSFTEFLLADAGDKLVSYLEAFDRIEPIPEAFFGPLCEKLKMYFVTGGMPRSVREWLQTRDVEAVQEALSGVIGVYERDMVRLTRSSEASKILRIWNAIPSQLAKENKKFLYRLIKEGARAREYEEALQWLVDAGLAYKICRSTTPGLPLAAFDDVSSFKIYPVDVGLLRRIARLTPTVFAEGNRLFTVNSTEP